MSELLRIGGSFEVAVNAFYIMRCSQAFENEEKMVMTDYNMVCFGIKWTRDRDVIVDIVTWQGK